MRIEYLKNNEISKKKWNDCINDSYNGIVYAYSWYLDIVCEEWEALIADDYSIVMPITSGRKFKFDYILQPIFAQQLGIFSTSKLTANIVDQFLDSIPPKFRLIFLNLNTFNNTNTDNFKIQTGITHEIDLIKPYYKTYRGYSNNTKRNIKKAIESKVSIMGGVAPNSIIDLFKENTGKKIKELTEKEYSKMRKLMSFAVRNRIGIIYGAYSEQNNLCASAFFIESHNKGIFLFGDSNEEGKENRAMFLLIDHYIKKNSETNLTLDFEGSKIEGVARFYSGFGAKACEFTQIKRNKLPMFIRPFVNL